MKRLFIGSSIAVFAIALIIGLIGGNEAARAVPEHKLQAPLRGPAFSRFPLNQRRPVEIDVDAEALAGLSKRQLCDQLRDWMLYVVVADSGVTAEEARQVLYDLPPMRRGYLTPVANYDYGMTRSRVIGPDAVALIPAGVDDAQRRDYIAEIADEYMKNTGKPPQAVAVFEYEFAGESGKQAWITRRAPVSGADAFSAEYGYRERKIASRDDFADFVSSTDDLLGVRLDGDNLLISGRKLQGARYNTVNLQDVAAIWQSEQAVDEARRKIEDFDRRWEHRLYSTEAEKVQLEMERDRELEALRAEIPSGVSSQGGHSGFSLDPHYEYDTLKEHFSRARPLLATLGARAGGWYTDADLNAVSDAIDRNDAIPLLKLLERLNKADTAPAALARMLLDAIDTQSQHQSARYDGKLQGTEVGMTLFYTDLLAKLWALDYHKSAPAQRIEDFVSLLRVSTASIYDKERHRLSSTRLWFGPQDRGFQTAAQGVRFSRTATRVYAASSNPAEPGKEAEPNADSAAFLGWWNDHYDDVARFEPQYQRLNEIMKWSVVLGWLNQHNRFAQLNYLNKVTVRRDLWFTDWVRAHPELRYRDWTKVAFYPRGYRDAKTETMPLLVSFNENRSRGYSGGVSLASKEKIAARAILSEDVPMLARRANLDYASVSGKEFLTLEKTAYKFEDLADGLQSRVIAQAKETAKFRSPGIELQRTEFDVTFRRQGEAFIADAAAGGRPMGSITVEPRANAFRVGFKSLDTEQVGHLAESMADKTLTGEAAEIALRDSGKFGTVVRVGKDHYLVQLRDGGRWAELEATELTENASTAMRAGAPKWRHQWNINWKEPEQITGSLGDGEYVVVRDAEKSRALAVDVTTRGPPPADAIAADIRFGDHSIPALRDAATGVLYVKRAEVPAMFDKLSRSGRDGVASLNRVAERFSEGKYSSIADEIGADPVRFKATLDAERARAYELAANDLAEGRFVDAARRVEAAKSIFGSDADQGMLESMTALLVDDVSGAAKTAANTGATPLRNESGFFAAIEKRLGWSEMPAGQRHNLSRLADLAYGRIHGAGVFDILPAAHDGNFNLAARLLRQFEQAHVLPGDLPRRVIYVEVGSRLDHPAMSLGVAMDEVRTHPDLITAFEVKNTALARAHPDTVTVNGRTYRLVGDSVVRATNQRCSGASDTGGCKDEVVLLGQKSA